MERKYLQNTYLIKDMYPKYKKLLKFNCKTTNQFKNALTCGQTSHQKTFTYGKQSYKSMLNTICHYRNTGENENEIPLHNCYNNKNLTNRQYQLLVRMKSNRNSHSWYNHLGRKFGVFFHS